MGSSFLLLGLLLSISFLPSDSLPSIDGGSFTGLSTFFHSGIFQQTLDVLVFFFFFGYFCSTFLSMKKGRKKNTAVIKAKRVSERCAEPIRVLLLLTGWHVKGRGEGMNTHLCGWFSYSFTQPQEHCLRVREKDFLLFCRREEFVLGKWDDEDESSHNTFVLLSLKEENERESRPLSSFTEPEYKAVRSRL